ncbi:murein transglycosylase A [Polynucleobacter sp. AP-RePozz3-80-G7]|uniref:murein transglycosylase A n=1 Tax=Polynucleobacter sp. AP-RePozz3-80-G7 TaxID=2689105 RepID=UPI001C0E1395|nr:MltA domain-containing protein [Polynucleobacter sp. AP-RePozz3-80-G7]MBU3638367.1 MltA domain-containing protein [Polynucleobacter sp. AP-RePozz3-80-G7]
MISKFKLVPLSVFAILMASLIAGCSTPPTRGTGYRSSGSGASPSSYKSSIASFSTVSWQALPGWQDDDLSQAWPAWLKSCEALHKKSGDVNWRSVCTQAGNVSSRDTQAIRTYFENNFQAYEIRNSSGSDTGLITGYYEPLMNGSQTRTSTYNVPLYGYPNAWRKSKPTPGPSRAELMSSGVLQGSEIAWVQDPVAAAFMQIQGSGKIRLEDGRILRLGFAGTNDQPFKSFAQWLLDRKEITRSEATMQGISQWAKRNPGQVNEMLNANPRFVFFKELPSNVSADLGPNGALGVPLTAERSIAVDLQALPLGAPVFLAATKPLSSQPLQKLVMAQDTGKAIVGGVRADYYWGSGDAAGEIAGRMKQNGRMWLLLPR